MTFQTGTETDWAAVLARAENPPEEPGPRSGDWLRERIKPILPFRPRASWRLWAALGGIALVLLARQIYFGGRIPLLREPENFRVDTVSSEDSAR